MMCSLRRGADAKFKIGRRLGRAALSNKWVDDTNKAKLASSATERCPTATRRFVSQTLIARWNVRETYIDIRPIT